MAMVSASVGRCDELAIIMLTRERNFHHTGMLSGVLFHSDSSAPSISPHFINRYIVTDVLLATSQKASRPILPSIATLASPEVSLVRILFEIMRSFLLCIATWIPYTWSLATRGPRRLAKISVANTSVYYHDGKVLAACESGPPLRVCLPEMDTGEWWTGDEGKSWAEGGGLAGVGPMKIFQEMTTAHPHTDMSNNELLLYHSSFVAPYLRVSVIPPRSSRSPALIGATVPGMKEGKLMHDFAATRTRTVMLDLPLSLDPRNLLKGKPIVNYDGDAGVRFGIFPRRRPHEVEWYSDPESCCIYHTANCWDEGEGQGEVPAAGDAVAVNFLACRLNSATLVYSVGNIAPPQTAMAKGGETERCELYYWRFQPGGSSSGGGGEKASPADAAITHAFPLSRIPFEFPTINLRYSPASGLGPNRYIYGCSMREGTFDAGMGRNSAKIDCLVKVNAQNLVAKGRRLADAGKLARGQAVDERSMMEILKSPSGDGDISVFPLPSGCYAQEASFVPRLNPQSEDDGFLVFFVFDELNGLNPLTGEAKDDATSELWIIEALNMRDIVCRIALPRRVPYGLHGRFFDREEIASQEQVDETKVRSWALRESKLRSEKEKAVRAEALRDAKAHSHRLLHPLIDLFTAVRGAVEALA